MIIKHSTHRCRETNLGTTRSGREKARGTNRAEDFPADLGQIHGRSSLKQPQRGRVQNPRAVTCCCFSIRHWNCGTESIEMLQMAMLPPAFQCSEEGERESRIMQWNSNSIVSWFRHIRWREQRQSVREREGSQFLFWSSVSLSPEYFPRSEVFPLEKCRIQFICVPPPAPGQRILQYLTYLFIFVN